jgi:anti-sigma-K factor RskA
MNDRDNLHVDDLLPAYVLGVLEDDEIVQVEEHLPTCETCRADLGRLRFVPDDLAYEPEPLTPDPARRAQLLARIQEESTPPQPQAPTEPPASERRGGLRGLLQNILGTSQREQDDAGDALLDIVASPDSAAWELRGTEEMPNGYARLIGVPGRSDAVLVTEGLSGLAADRVYQLWLIAADQPPVPSITFRVDQRGRGHATLRAPVALSQYAVAAITPEPTGGSPGPTGAIVVMGNLTQD